MHGIPIISFNGKGYDSVLADESQGKLIGAEDVDGFAKGVLLYYEQWKDAQAYSKMMDKIRAVAERTYGEDQIMEKMARMFSELA